MTTEREAMTAFARLGMFRWVSGPNRMHLVLVIRKDGETQPTREPNGRVSTACLLGPFQLVEAGDRTLPVCDPCWRFWVELLAPAELKATR